jgi:biopolymer transport protein ExbD
VLEYLKPKLERNPEKPVIIRPEPSAPYGRMVDVMDELRQGKDKLGLKEEIRITLPTQREMEQLWF